MAEIPIFDCLTHPSLDGSWISPCGDGKNTFEQITSSMKAANVKWAWAVSMGSQGAYETNAYLEACQNADVKLFPVAFMDVASFETVEQVEDWLLEQKQKGFLGIKLHPRLGRFNFETSLLPTIIKSANKYNLVPLLCTYFYSSDPMCSTLSVASLRALLHETIGEKLILLHSGTTQLLEVSEMTRPFKTVLLDLSFTLSEYVGSSLDLDLRFVLDKCRGRVCIGSDSPEVSHQKLRSRFETLTRGFSHEHKQEIAFQNLFTFTSLSK